MSFNYLSKATVKPTTIYLFIHGLQEYLPINLILYDFAHSYSLVALVFERLVECPGFPLYRIGDIYN